MTVDVRNLSPDIVGDQNFSQNAMLGGCGGSFYNQKVSDTSKWNELGVPNTVASYYKLGFKASASSAIFGRHTTNQMASLRAMAIIKI